MKPITLSTTVGELIPGGNKCCSKRPAISCHFYIEATPEYQAYCMIKNSGLGAHGNHMKHPACPKSEVKKNE